MPEDRPPPAPGPTVESRPAYYAARSGRWRDWWTLLHPPYTAWHLGYVVIGACLAPVVTVSWLLATLGGFFLAVGVTAHALDELAGRPLRTAISSTTLAVVAAVCGAGALGLGIYGVTQVGWVLIPFLILGPVLVLGYNLELFGGVLHGDVMFALAWGAFPVLTAYVVQAGTVRLAAAGAAGAAFALSAAQRRLSTPARMLRRRTTAVDGRVTLADGATVPLDQAALLAPLEYTLRAMSWGVVLMATALAVARLT